MVFRDGHSTADWGQIGTAKDKIQRDYVKDKCERGIEWGQYQGQYRGPARGVPVMMIMQIPTRRYVVGSG